MFHIFDIDNCISDDSHRIHLIDQKEKSAYWRYYDYHVAGIHDPIENKEKLKLIDPTSIIFFTGTTENFRCIKEEWLYYHGINYRKLFMRSNDDYRSAVKVKRDMLKSLYMQFDIGVNDIAAAYDDRLDIVEMYRAEGIQNAIQLKVNDYDKNI